jgi:uncharacterized integral membrane protein
VIINLFWCKWLGLMATLLVVICLMLFRIDNQTKVNIITNWLNSQLKNPTG